MKNLFLYIGIVLLSLSKLSAQDEIANYFADTLNSYVQWTGEKLLGTHTGKVLLDSSWMEFKNGNIIKGEFIIDMATITNEDIEDSTEQATLVRHLKNKDFFWIEKYPVSKLKIIRAIHNPRAKKNQPNYTIISELSIKDSTHNIVFPAKIILNDKELMATANFKIDRTKYGIIYNSGKFFSDIGDLLIKDYISFDIKLKCHRIFEEDKNTTNTEVEQKE
jgi:polyisoprenoid-binding protein YceI